MRRKTIKIPPPEKKKKKNLVTKKLFKYYGLSTPENEDFCQPNLLVWWWRTKKISAFFSSPCPKFLTVGHLVCGNWFRLSKLNFGLVGASKIASSLLSLLYSSYVNQYFSSQVFCYSAHGGFLKSSLLCFHRQLLMVGLLCQPLPFVPASVTFTVPGGNFLWSNLGWGGGFLPWIKLCVGFVGLTISKAGCP